jgi:hypothetical protein
MVENEDKAYAENEAVFIPSYFVCQHQLHGLHHCICLRQQQCPKISFEPTLSRPEQLLTQDRQDNAGKSKRKRQNIVQLGKVRSSFDSWTQRIVNG